MHIATIRFMSKALFMPTEVTVLLPEEPRNPGEKLKAVWLLHGACGDHKTFLYQVDFDRILRKHHAAVIMPSALNSDYVDYERFGTGYRFTKYFFEELMPFAQSTFGVSERREDNFIEGVSMGGFGAMSLGLLHPEKFAAIGMLGASLRESRFLKDYEEKSTEEFRADALSNPQAFPTEYGAKEVGIKPKEVNVITRYATVREFLDSPDCAWNRLPEVAARGELPYIYAACGTADLFYEANLRLRERMRELGVEEKAYFRVPEGVGHDNAFFGQEIENFMDCFEI